MSVLGDGIIAFLAAVGIVTLVWVLAGALLRRREPSIHAVIVLPVKGQAEQMDYAVMTACNLCPRLGRYTPVVLVDCGLEEAGRQRAEFLTQNNNCVTVLLPSQLQDYIT